jgi:hypothetical protein
MPRYFFHILHPDSEPFRDEEGGDFDNFEQARSEAVHGLRYLALDIARQGRIVHGLSVQIADKDGTVLETLNAHESFTWR